MQSLCLVSCLEVETYIFSVKQQHLSMIFFGKASSLKFLWELGSQVPPLFPGLISGVQKFKSFKIELADDFPWYHRPK